MSIMVCINQAFATNADVYEDTVIQLFKTLDKLEDHLADNRYLMGARFTEADIRFFATLIRFDPVYVGILNVI